MEYEIKVQDLIEHIRFGTQMKYDIKDYVVAIEGLLDLYNKEKNKELTDEYMIQKHLINSDFLKDYISKDKIKEKIKYIEENYSEHSGFPIGKSIEFLQELLEERN